jgi:hypothetical protein
MPKKWIRHPMRKGQLVTPFGPGSLTGTTSGFNVVICGADQFFKRESEDVRDRETINPDEFEINDWRLAKELGVDFFRSPPDYRYSFYGQDIDNKEARIPALVFPTYFVCNNKFDGGCNTLFSVRDNQRASIRCPRCKNKYPNDLWKAENISQVRFITICSKGHLQDFPWLEWVHGEKIENIDNKCKEEGQLTMNTGSSAALGSIQVGCRNCNKKRSFDSRLFSLEGEDESSSWLEENLYHGNHKYKCPGKRPWLGRESEETCNEGPIMGLRAQGNLYFPITRSSILMPSSKDSLLSRIESILQEPKFKQTRKILSIVSVEDKLFKDELNDFVEKYPEFKKESVYQVMKTINNPSDEEDAGLTLPENRVAREQLYKFIEFENLKEEKDLENQLIVNKIDIKSFLKKNNTKNYENIFKYFSTISLVKKLVETTALEGFTRVKSSYNPADIQSTFHPDNRDAKWLLARQSHGEGIFLEFDEEHLIEWEERTSVKKRSQDLRDSFLSNEMLRHKIHLSSPRALLIHTFSHVLMNELIYQCGYGSSSIRERLYISDETETKMSGLMVYTSAGDTTGSMGGLVRMGQPHILGNVIRSALLKAKWCSRDPSCASATKIGPTSCNNSACLSCSYMPEPSCEVSNNALDRGLLGVHAIEEDCSFFDIE